MVSVVNWGTRVGPVTSWGKEKGKVVTLLFQTDFMLGETMRACDLQRVSFSEMSWVALVQE